MKTLILFYSYTGSCRKLAEHMADQLHADLEEVKTVKRPGTISAYVTGSIAALGHKTTDIQPIRSNLEEYEKIVVISPIWAGSPAPAFNSAVTFLPKNKELELCMVSASGNSSKDKVLSFLTDHGFQISEYNDIKSSTIK